MAKSKGVYYGIYNGWVATFGSSGDWRWTCPLPNGWMAGVEDDSQTYDPPVPTRYRIYAISGGIMLWGDTVGQLIDAKAQALRLALDQTPSARKTGRSGLV